MASIAITAPNPSHTARLARVPTTWSKSGITRMSRFRFTACCSRRRAAMTPISARAFSMETPGFSRPITSMPSPSRPERAISRSSPGWSYGNGRNTTALSTLNIATLAPMPTPRMIATETVNSRSRPIARNPSRTSRTRSSIHGRPRWSRSASIACDAPPALSRASRAASAEAGPRRRASSAAISTCSRSSSFRSPSRRPGSSVPRRR
jgi:hypothetical protein